MSITLNKLINEELSKLSEKDRKLLKDKAKKQESKKFTKESLSQLIGEEFDKLTEGRMKKVSKSMWKKMKENDRVNALLSAFSDPDDAEEHWEKDWEDLPSVATSNMYLYEGKLNEITLKGKDAELWIKNWTAGGRLNINNMIYKALGKGKWKGPDGKKLSWKEVAAKASALGDKTVFFEGKLNEVTAKDTFYGAVNALTKTIGGRKFDKGYVKDYLKQIEKMARKNPGQFVKDYGDFKVGDWIEDVRYNMANESVNENKLNEISVKAGLQDVLKGRTTSIEGIKISKRLAMAITTWIAQSAFGRKYNKQILKGRIGSLIKPMASWGLDRFLDSKTRPEWKQILSKHQRGIKEGVSNYIHIEKTFTLKDMKGQTVTLRKGQVGTHRRISWDEDIMTFGNHRFDASPGSEWSKKVKRDMISVS
jgi:hypothetical protein